MAPRERSATPNGKSIVRCIQCIESTPYGVRVVPRSPFDLQLWMRIDFLSPISRTHPSEKIRTQRGEDAQSPMKDEGWWVYPPCHGGHGEGIPRESPFPRPNFRQVWAFPILPMIGPCGGCQAFLFHDVWPRVVGPSISSPTESAFRPFFLPSPTDGLSMTTKQSKKWATRIEKETLLD